MMDDGNARVAALRTELLAAADLRRLEVARTAAELLDLLAREAAWGTAVREAGPGSGPAAVVAATVERRRAGRLAALPRFYRPDAASLVEALVLHLDGERILAVLRRRRGGEPPESIATTIVRGALLDEADLAGIARAPDAREVVRLAARLGVLDRETAHDAVAALRGTPAPPLVEAVLSDALDRSRAARAAGPGRDAETVRGLLEVERRDRHAVMAELREAGAGAASHLERSLTAARLTARIHASRRDPLGIGVPAGYVGAVELETIRLRGALARVVAGWSDPVLAGIVGAAA